MIIPGWGHTLDSKDFRRTHVGASRSFPNGDATYKEYRVRSDAMRVAMILDTAITRIYGGE